MQNISSMARSAAHVIAHRARTRARGYVIAICAARCTHRKLSLNSHRCLYHARYCLRRTRFRQPHAVARVTLHCGYTARRSFYASFIRSGTPRTIISRQKYLARSAAGQGCPNVNINPPHHGFHRTVCNSGCAHRQRAAPLQLISGLHRQNIGKPVLQTSPHAGTDPQQSAAGFCFNASVAAVIAAIAAAIQAAS